jgi:hypothetical protein
MAQRPIGLAARPSDQQLDRAIAGAMLPCRSIPPPLPSAWGLPPQRCRRYLDHEQRRVHSADNGHPEAADRDRPSGYLRTRAVSHEQPPPPSAAHTSRPQRPCRGGRDGLRARHFLGHLNRRPPSEGARTCRNAPRRAKRSLAHSSTVTPAKGSVKVPGRQGGKVVNPTVC